MTCGDCAQNLDEVPPGQPCPACGSARRNAVVHVQAALAVATVGTVGVSVGYAPARPWQQKWREVREGLHAIEQLYQRSAENNEIVRVVVEAFFKNCRELADWLQEDAGQVTAIKHANTDPDLQLCDGLAQTVKHHTRRRGTDPITARVAQVDSGFGVTARLEWSTPSGRSGSEDALALARRCVAAWEGFLKTQGLNPAI
jgi:hypothetical protein